MQILWKKKKENNLRWLTEQPSCHYLFTTEKANTVPYYKEMYTSALLHQSTEHAYSEIEHDHFQITLYIRN
jgi:hypothetical protein